MRGKPESELQKQLGELKTELGNLRLYRVFLGFIIIEAYRSKRYVPKDLRPKKTRAIRRRLTKKEQSIHSARSMRKARAFPRRVFAIKC
ncbi:unnamed protein product [Trichobilharzia regenti]|nr:unnamed protein product [Trichobilharzia regenti]